MAQLVGPQPPIPAPGPPAIAEEYWLEGDPVRALVADVESFRSPPGNGPRAAPIRALVDGRRWAVPGAYLLLWEQLDGRVPVYIGSAGDLLERLNRHEQVNWTLGIAITGHGLHRSAALQVERSLGQAFMLADTAQNLWEKRWDAHPTFAASEMPWPFLTPMLVLAERLVRLHSPLTLAFDPQGAGGS
jgi:hypothetical protein